MLQVTVCDILLEEDSQHHLVGLLRQVGHKQDLVGPLLTRWLVGSWMGRVRERERGRGREGERERGRGREREGGRERETETERERERVTVEVHCSVLSLQLMHDPSPCAGACPDPPWAPICCCFAFFGICLAPSSGFFFFLST